VSVRQSFFACGTVTKNWLFVRCCSFCSTEAHHRIVVAVVVVVASVVVGVLVAAACSFLFMLQHADAPVAYTLSSD